MMVDWFGHEIVDRNHTHHMMNPGLTRVEIRVAPPGKLGAGEDRGYVLYHTHLPIDRENVEWHWIVNTPAHYKHAGNPSKSVAERFSETFPSVVEEDRWALEKQQKMFEYDDDGYSEVPLKTDKAVLSIRKLFTALEAEESGATAA